MDWFVATLRQYPEIALFLSLGIGYWVGGKSFKGFSLGAVTATLLAAIAIGQLGIKISPRRQGDVLSDLPLCDRLRRRPAVHPWHHEGRPAAGDLRRRGLRVLPRRLRRRCESRGLRRRCGGGPLCRIANDLCIDGPGDGRHQSARRSRRIRQRQCSTSCRRRTP